MKSIIIDVRNEDLKKNKIKEYINDNVQSTYESPYLHDVIYAYTSQEIFDNLKAKNLKIEKQHDFIFL